MPGDGPHVQKVPNINKQGCYLTPVGALGWSLDYYTSLVSKIRRVRFQLQLIISSDKNVNMNEAIT
jgi:hypothetical protein